MFEKLKFITRLFSSTNQSLPLGRWRLKHDFESCQKYMTNNYGDPGYQNIYKNEWIKNLEKKENKENKENINNKNINKI